MDLLELLKTEIHALNITDKVAIARYIYIRIGELFEYDPLYEVIDSNNYEAQFELINKRIDIRNVTDFNVICYSWSHMYHDLLKAFDIDSEVVETFCHNHVVAKIDEKEYIADLMKDYQDLFLIKFGLKTKYNYQMLTTKAEQKSQLDLLDKEINYYKGIHTEDVLQQIKTELQSKYKDSDDYMYNTFQTVANIMNFHRKNVNVGYISGRVYIRYLLRYFLDDSYKACSARIYNTNDDTYIQAYSVKSKNKEHYFIYQKMNNNYYEMNEINKNLVEYLIKSKNYKSSYSKNLHLAA